MATLDPHFTFENFVVGPANRLASAAARRAAERPGVSYNPLFIHASTGLGKTHLLGAMARHIAKVSPGKEVAYQTAQEFLRDFARTSGVKGAEEVRERYQDLDILLLDDVQFLTTQGDFQDLLLLTLDILTGDGKQVVLASDRPPAEIQGLAAHLRTRFEGGLVVNIGPPEYETRVAIIQKDLEGSGKGLQTGVADSIGRHPFKTIRDLRGCLDRILEVQEGESRLVSPDEATALIQEAEEDDSGLGDAELGQFLDEISGTVAAKVQAQEAPWRKLLREAVEEIEAEGFKGDILRRHIDDETSPPDPEGILAGFQRIVQRLREIRTELDAAGNPWPEAAFGVLRDPGRLDEAEALLSSAQERSRSFPAIPEGPDLKEIGKELPQLVVRAADQLVTTERPEYNPLFVWSPDGMAARALLHASGRAGILKEEGARVALVSVPMFAEEFIHALSSGVAGAWRERWWSVDLLLVEGAQDLSATERAQEEFFHLFEALQRRGARVMISADRAPSEISALDDRLRARLDGGLVIEVPVESTDLSPELQAALAVQVEAESESEVEEEEEPEKDIAVEDREWIQSFRTQTSQDGSGVGDGTSGGGFLDVLARGVVPTPPGEPWRPSPEKVVWDWPRLEDRLAEVPE
jgi:chromosomal replication initiation ATPase DnaA